MKNFFLKLSIIFTILCISTNYILSQNYSILPNVSTIYAPNTTYLHPQYKLLLVNKKTAEVYIKLYTKELNFIQLANKKFQAKINIKYIFYLSLEKTTIIDSASKTYTLNKRSINGALVTKFEIKIPQDNCFLVIITSDLYNMRKSLNFIRIGNYSSSPANFLLVDSASNLPVFSNYIKPYKTYYIKTFLSSDSLLVQKFPFDSLFPTPPFSNMQRNFVFKTDTQFYIHSSSYLKMRAKGIYKITNPLTKASFNVINLGNYYPNIYTPEQMIPPLKYFASSEEFLKLKNIINKKLAVDNFWLNKDSDPDKARNMIKIYYNRVLLANYYFTSTKQGWKTDRGMLYVIFGPPSILHKADNTEEWIYYSAYKGKKISFIFNRIVDKNNFVNFVLSRNSNYILSWKTAIDDWNKGIIYSF